MSSSLLLRVVKRRTSLELLDASEVCSVEFRTREGEPDLRVSTYEIEDAQISIVQAHAEHSANIPLHPPCGGPSLDLCGIGDPVPTPGTRFKFTTDAHREICFDDRSKLLAGVAVVLGELASRRREATRNEVRAYVRGRLDERDPEWCEVCDENGAWRKWATGGG